MAYFINPDGTIDFVDVAHDSAGNPKPRLINKSSSKKSKKSKKKSGQKPISGGLEKFFKDKM